MSYIVDIAVLFLCYVLSVSLARFVPGAALDGEIDGSFVITTLCCLYVVYVWYC